MASALKKLTAALEDPLRSQFCVCCLAKLLPAVSSDAQRIFVTTLRRDYPELLNAALSYIIITSSFDAEIPAVELHLIVQTRQCRNCPRREHSKTCTEHQGILDLMNAGALRLAVGMLCSVIRICLEAAEQGSTKRFSRHRWPTRVDDLLPRGGEATIRALCVWLSQIKAAEVIETVRVIYNGCHAELLSCIVIILDAIPESLDSVTAELREMTPSQRAAVSGTRHPTRRLNALAALLRDIFYSLASSPEVVFKILYADPSLVARLVRSISSAVDVATPGTSSVLTFIASLVETLGGRAPPSSIQPAAILQSMGQWSPSAFGSLHHHLSDTLRRRACGRRDCTITERTSGTSMLLCAQCRVFYYCSKECQRLHWKSGHKSVCQTLRRLFDAANIAPFTLDLLEPDFTAACRAVHLSDEDLEAVADAYASIAMEDKTRASLGSAEVWKSVWLQELKAEQEGIPGPSRIGPTKFVESLIKATGPPDSIKDAGNLGPVGDSVVDIGKSNASRNE